MAADTVISSDATARFMAVGISKSVVIDLPTDIDEVIVGDKTIAVVVMDSKHRAYIIGAKLGQTNVYFFAADEPIAALDIAVTSTSQSATLENYPFPANVVSLYNGTRGTAQTISCTSIKCIDANQPGSNQPPGTQNINVTGNASSGVTVAPGAAQR
jgi:alpha-D-ribose 1-methylphosphonate 5-phosphate C-P lyase